MKKKKGLLFAVIASVVVLTDFTLFDQQIVSAVWEARTGFHRDLGGIRCHVPLFYVSSASDAYGQYDFSTMPSPTRKKYATITVDVRNGLRDGPQRSRSPQVLGMMHQRLTGQRTVNLAGRTGNCLEYAGDTGFLDIDCYFGPDLQTSFMGSPNAAEDFYTFMNRAEPLPKKN